MDLGSSLLHLCTRATVLAAVAATGAVFAAGLGATSAHATPSGDTNPAKLEVLRAGVSDGRLDVLADITKRADGDRVRVSFIANGKRSGFTAPIKDGRIRFKRMLPASQRHMSTGIMEIHYEGNDRVRPTEVRLRAANGKARLQRNLLSLHNGVITAEGSLADRAGGVVRLILSYVRPNGTVGEWQGRASIRDDGRWRLEENLPADARDGGYLSVQYTGYHPRRIRGEQLAKELLDGQSFGLAEQPAPVVGSAPAAPVSAPPPAPVTEPAPTPVTEPAPTPVTEPAPTPTKEPAPVTGTGLSDSFSLPNGPNGLITNEYGFWSTDLLGVRSPNWEVTSGSLFSQDGMGWSGKVDAVTPDRYSENGTGSYVFRMRTKQRFTGSTRQEVIARINSFYEGTQARPSVAWDGVVLWPRYVSERQLYFAYILRKDGRVAITKKCEGQIAGGNYYNGGTYFQLYSERYYADTTIGKWYHLATETTDNADGSVTVRIFRDGRLAAQATDSGVGCSPIKGSARLGIRADNADFNIDDYVATPLS